MSRAGLCIAAIAAVFVGGCGEGDAVVQSPTGPTRTTASAPPAPPSQGSCVPAAPANLAVASVAGTTVTLTWSATSGATQYVVLVGSTSSSSNILSTNTTQSSYQWGGVPPGHHYARVQAMNSCGSSGSSNEVDFTV